jgi:hypothetical protein
MECNQESRRKHCKSSYESYRRKGNYMQRHWQKQTATGFNWRQRRGRRHPERLQIGDALDFWRVLDLDPPGRLRLLAEMKTPGPAVLDSIIADRGGGTTELSILSHFEPLGLWGLVYRYGSYPFHETIFYGMLKAMARRIGAPVVAGPQRFTPRMPPACEMR